jgi:hypothetical protein
MVAMHPEELFQVIIRGRQLGHIIAVKKAWPVAPGDFAEMREGRGTRTNGGLVASHCTKQAAEAALYG